MKPSADAAPSQRARTIRVLIASLVIPLLAVLCYRLAWPNYKAFLLALDHSPVPFGDFSTYYYKTGRGLLETKLPSFNFLYPPFFAVLMVPLGRMELPDALAWWTGIQILTTWLFILLPALFFARRSERLAYAAIALASFSHPILHNFRWGQVSVLVTLPLVLALWAHERKRTWLAAVLVAFACAIKIYPGIVALYFLFRRDFRFVLVFGAATALFAFVLPALLLGVAETWMFYLVVREMMQTLMPAVLVDPNSQQFSNVLARLTGKQDLRGIFAPLAALLGAVGVGAAFRGVWRRVDLSAERAFALLLLVAPLWVESSWPHYFVYLPACQVLAWSLVPPSASIAGRVTQRVVIGTSALLSSVVMFGLSGGLANYPRLGFLLFSDLLLLGVMAWQTFAAAPELETSPAPAPLPLT